ncbi:MAG: phospholipid carrier-dependent glycosyltransferase [Planctomycetaceae bacterium]|nr:phospholipid carrier-dependent glycosyltransferase [Planctomycetaceae bacterium]
MSGMTKKNEAALPKGAASSIFRILFPILTGLLAFFAVAASVDVADDCPATFDGPGLTFDEGFYVGGGAYLVESIRRNGVASLHPQTLQDIFNDPLYLPDHPPLGRLWLGLVTVWLHQPGDDDPRPYLVTFARYGSAVLFGLLVGMITCFVGKWGAPPVAAGGSAVALVTMPRLFGHSHLATLEPMMDLTYAATILFTADRLAGKERLQWKDGVLPGILLGLALLTKMQGVFLVPLLTIWLLGNWRWQGILSLVVVAVTSFAVFFVGWPWLWTDPLPRIWEYFARSTERPIIYCYYLGTRYADRDVPWHYPWVMFTVTMPLLWLALGTWGLVPRDSNKAAARRWQLLIGGMALPFIVFTIPGVPVYDGVRLFLVSFPLWGVFVGMGVHRLLTNPTSPSDEMSHDTKRRKWVVNWGTVFLFASVVGSLWRLHPLHLSYFNELTGGLSGATNLGMEPTYWGDSVTPEFLRRCHEKLPDGATVAIAPVLHPAILSEMWPHHTWLRHRPDLQFVAYDDQQQPLPEYVIVIRRHADPWASLTPPPEGTKRLAAVERSGVFLAELLKLPVEDAIRDREPETVP